MADKKNKKKKMVYTPKCHIPIGEAVKMRMVSMHCASKSPTARTLKWFQSLNCCPRSYRPPKNRAEVPGEDFATN